MKVESHQLTSTSEEKRVDKIDIVFHQKLVSVILAVCSCINLILLFVLTGYSGSVLLRSFAIVNTLIFVTALLIYYWCRVQSEYLALTDDEYGEETDNFMGRFLFFMCILLCTLELVLGLLYLLGQDFIFGQFMALGLHGIASSFDLWMVTCYPFIIILTITILLVLIYAVHNFYLLSISQNTSRFNIYLLSTSIGFSFWTAIYLVSKYTDYKLPQFVFLIVQVLVLLTVICNAFRWKVAFIRLASFQVVLIPLIIGYQALFIREFRELEAKGQNDCQSNMSKVQDEYLQNQGCSSKYKKDNNNFSGDCDRSSMTVVWEHPLSDNSPQLGCLNPDCCIQAVNIFTREYLLLIAVSLGGALLLLALVLFQFHVSQRPRSDRTLGRDLELILLGLYLIALAGGICMCIYMRPSATLAPVVNFAEQAIKAKEFATIKTLDCQPLSQVIGNQLTLSNTCISTDCPLNKQTDKYETKVLFGIWVKGVSSFVKDQRIIYQSDQVSKFLWPGYVGDSSDAFAILDTLPNVQSFVNSLKVCYKTIQTDLQISLYQNQVQIAVNTTGAVHNSLHHIFQSKIHEQTTPANTPVKPATTTGSTIPNCKADANNVCTTCNDGFTVDDTLGCKFKGVLTANTVIKVNLFKSSTARANGFVLGEYISDGISTRFPLSGASVCWEQEDQKPICATSVTDGSFNFQVPTYDVADWSAQQFQPVIGKLTVKATGFQTRLQNQVMQFSERTIYLGVLILSQNVNYPPPNAILPISTSNSLEEHRQTASTTCTATQFKDGDGTCRDTLCTNQTNCNMCNSANICQSCKSEYKLVNNICSPINDCSAVHSINNCLQCDAKDKTKCTQCDIFSTLANGQCTKKFAPCLKAVPNCQICVTDNTCAVCDKEYKLINGACESGDFKSIFQVQNYNADINIVDAMDHSPIDNASITINLGTCGSTVSYGKGKSDKNGNYQIEVLKGKLYAITITAQGFKNNCYEFQDKLKVYIPISKELQKGQQRIVLEWSTNVDLDLSISFNPVKSQTCVVGFLNKACTGTKFGVKSDSQYQFEAITIEQLANTKYLIFVTAYGQNNSDFIYSKAQIKYYIYDRQEPAVIYNVPYDPYTPYISTDQAYESKWLSWLVSCIDAAQSEIPQNIAAQNGIWWTTAINRWFSQSPQKTDQNMIPSSALCNL